MASKNSAWFAGLVVGVLSSIAAAGVDAWIGGARLRADGPAIFDQSVGAFGARPDRSYAQNAGTEAPFLGFHEDP